MPGIAPTAAAASFTWDKTPVSHVDLASEMRAVKQSTAAS